jgi:hypothetical protein
MKKVPRHIAEKLNIDPNTEFIVGGYHAHDCPAPEVL